MDKNIPNKLKIPEGVIPAGPVEDAADAYLKSVLAIPVMLEGIAEQLSAISDHLSVLALYAEKKGVQDGVIGPDDIRNVEPDNE